MVYFLFILGCRVRRRSRFFSLNMDIQLFSTICWKNFSLPKQAITFQLYIDYLELYSFKIPFFAFFICLFF